MPRLSRILVWMSVGGGVLLAAVSAEAHWCHDNWGSAYNLVVRPAQDTVAVPSSGTVNLDVDVQNNIGEALPNFNLTASSTGYTVEPSGNETGIKTGYLLPGEKLRYSFRISRSGGGSLAVDDITFLVSFGSGGQSGLYGEPSQGRDVVIKKVSGAIVPPRPLSELNQGNDQARHLQRAAEADYGTLATGLDQLMEQYCAGRRSWDHGSPAVVTTYCPNASTAGSCSPDSVIADGTKYDFQHLWTAQELASRKPALGGTRIAVLRQRLQCGWDDPHTVFKYMAGFVLGYLGEDAGARSFLEGKISSGSADDQTAAKAALLMFGNAADHVAYHDDVVACMSSSNDRLAATCAAALGVADRDDQAVTQFLVPIADWICPVGCGGEDDQGTGLLAAHLLAIVAWDRRGYAVDAGDSGNVSFYGQSVPDTTDPRAPASVSCTASPGGTIRVSWSQVTTDVEGNPEAISGYRVYRGTQPRTAGCLEPGCATDYTNSETTTSTYRDFSALDGTQTYYFAVIAVDAAGNTSVYSAETSCTPVYAPVAVISCSPTSGEAPLSVTCDSSGSSDPNGPGDIASVTFALDGQPEVAATEITYDFADAASHTVVLTVSDQGGLWSKDQEMILVSVAGNNPPIAAASADPTSGQVPLTVSFSSAGSTDADPGQTLSFAWDFRDGGSSFDANPTHTFGAPGVYDVVLTVYDDGTPQAMGTAIVTIDVRGNSPPDVSSASATPTFGPVPLTVTFDASGVTDPDGNNVALEWDFGDGSGTSSEATVEHVYSAAGIITARLTAQDDGTPTVPPATRSFTINPGGGPPENHAPDCAAATVAPLSGDPPLTVTLDASGCVDPEDNGMTFFWRIPTSLTTDDTFDTPTAEYTFTQEGEHLVYLTVTDDGDRPMAASREWTVSVGAGAGGVGEGPWELTSSCACRATTASESLSPLVLLLLWAWCRRRR